MIALQKYRRQKGLSQRKLAQRAGLAYKTVQLLEKGGHDSRWSTLTKLAEILEISEPQTLVQSRVAGFLTAAETANRIGQTGKDSWKLWLFEFVDAFRRAPDPGRVARAPSPEVSSSPLALIASTVESLCAEHGIAAPWWCAGAPGLPEPWFVAGVEALKAAALVESPAAFRQRNIFVLGNFLSRT